MESIVVPIQDAIALASCTREDQTDVDYFASDTSNCTLNCRKTSEHRNRKAAAFHTSPFQVEHVASSAGRGCRGCKFLSLLLSGMFAAYPEFSPDNARLRWTRAQFTLEVTSNNESPRLIQFFYPRGAKTRVFGMPPSGLLTGDTSSRTSFDRAYKLIQQCEANHQSCRSGRNVALPKRLLNVAEISNSGADIGIKLVTTEGMTGTYACLSHCWGDPTLIHTKTLSSTIDDYYNFISWAKLPKTFQDAVTLCRKLCIEYLWIDSLCIIQDSRSDWEVESTKMGDIYRNSYITIAASASPGSFGGCFSKTTSDHCIGIKEAGQQDVFIGIRDCNGAGKSTRNMEESFFKHFPLFSRAWVYQERMLSRRLLYCNKAEFQVGCQETLQCECGSGQIAPHFSPAPRGLNVATLKGPASLKPDEHGGGLVGQDFTSLVYRNWMEVVETYAKLNLTKGSDKLPALSATARILAENLGDGYLAGIWRSTLMEGLLWYVRAPLSRPRPRGEDWRAPSWSWASIDSPSGLGFIAPATRFSKSFEGKIEAAECVVAGQDDFGQVTSGFIRLRAFLGRTFWRIRCRGCTTPAGRKGKAGLPRADYTLYTNETFPSQEEGWVPCEFSEPRLDVMDASLGFFADALIDDMARYGFFSCIGKGSCKLAVCHLLYIHRFEGRGGGIRKAKTGERGIDADAFLALAEVKSQSGTFERIGLVTMTHNTQATREQWFKSVWPGILSPEKSITLI
ncbi:heterokaryon incompatibility domain-containing protein [Trichoderma barbatum]